jgi:hypothetical protein
MRRFPPGSATGRDAGGESARSTGRPSGPLPGAGRRRRRNVRHIWRRPGPSSGGRRAAGERGPTRRSWRRATASPRSGTGMPFARSFRWRRRVGSSKPRGRGFGGRLATGGWSGQRPPSRGRGGTPRGSSSPTGTRRVGVTFATWTERAFGPRNGSFPTYSSATTGAPVGCWSPPTPRVRSCSGCAPPTRAPLSGRSPGSGPSRSTGTSCSGRTRGAGTTSSPGESDRGPP